MEPLEEEINALKEKIRAQDAQLRAHEAQQAASLHTADLVAPLLQGTDTQLVVTQLDEKVLLVYLFFAVLLESVE